MNKITLLLMLCSGHTLFGQDILSSAQTTVLYHPNGDPVNNIVKANGAKHGVWTYKDNQDRVFYKQVFNNNALVSSYYSLENGSTNSWIDLQGFQNYSAQFRAFLKDKMIELFENYYDKQFFLVHTNGNVSIFFVGDWTESQKVQYESVIEQLLAQNTYESTTNFYLYID